MSKIALVHAVGIGSDISEAISWFIERATQGMILLSCFAQYPSGSHGSLGKDPHRHVHKHTYTRTHTHTPPQYALQNKIQQWYLIVLFNAETKKVCSVFSGSQVNRK